MNIKELNRKFDNNFLVTVQMNYKECCDISNALTEYIALLEASGKHDLAQRYKETRQEMALLFTIVKHGKAFDYNFREDV